MAGGLHDVGFQARNSIALACVLAAHAVLIWALVVSSDRLQPQAQPRASGTTDLLVNFPSARRTVSAPRFPAPQLTIPPIDLRPPARDSIPALPSEVGQDTEPAPPMVDWAEQLELAARSAGLPNDSPTVHDFGFPAAGHPSEPALGEFDWDYARTHRVQSIPQGGVVIHLNDNCVIVVAPLPLAFCLIGKKKVNGNLFQHLRDPRRLGDWKPQ